MAETYPEENENIYCVEDGQDLSVIPTGVNIIVFPDLNNNWNYGDLLQLPKSVEELYLGHDGVIYGTGNLVRTYRTISTEDVERLFKHLTKLKKIQVCGYYSQFECDLEQLADQYDVNVE